MISHIDKRKFGPWALVTGASSGIGREFARQIAASGINVVLVARREHLLQEVSAELAKTYGVETRVVVADLSEEGFMARLAPATQDLDIGLVVSNAGTAMPGEFLKLDYDESKRLTRLNALAHLDIVHYFGQHLVHQRRGGILLCGAMGATQGVPYMANISGAKSYVQSFGEALHVELKPYNVNVTVLVVGPTRTPIIEKFGLDPDTMPMKLMTVEQCVYEALEALGKNQSSCLPGRMNRIMNALVPAKLSRHMMGKMLGSAVQAQNRFSK